MTNIFVQNILAMSIEIKLYSLPVNLIYKNLTYKNKNTTVINTYKDVYCNIVNRAQNRTSPSYFLETYSPPKLNE